MPGQTYDDLVKAPRVALVLGVAAIAMAASACSGDDEPLIETGEVGAATVVEIVEAPATVVAAASASVAAPATGTVQAIRVRDGQQVRKGDVLLVVDSPEAQQRLAQAQQAAAACSGECYVELRSTLGHRMHRHPRLRAAPSTGRGTPRARSPTGSCEAGTATGRLGPGAIRRSADPSECHRYSDQSRNREPRTSVGVPHTGPAGSGAGIRCSCSAHC